MSEIIYRCGQCGANWTANQYTKDCNQCGGGSMYRGCILCDGRCGTVYNRAVIDSWDSGEAHWVGACKLPEEEKNILAKEWLDKS